MEKEIFVTLLMPCLNEERTLQECIRQAKRFLDVYQIQGEILVVDNGSTDRSLEIAKQEKVTVVRCKEKGYGNALRLGILKARGKYCIMGDCDGSYDFMESYQILTCLQKGYQLVVGNRMHKFMKKHAMPWTHKYIGVPFLSWLGRKSCNVFIHDFHCGLRGVETKIFQSLRFESTGMEFASEMIKIASKHKIPMTQIDITLYPDKRNRKSHLRPLRDGIRHIYILLKD